MKALLFFLCLFFPVWAAEPLWNGELAVSKEVLLPRAPDREREEFQSMIERWKQHKAKIWARHPQAGPEERRVLESDSTYLDNAILDALHRMGGLVQLETTTYTVFDAPLTFEAIATSSATVAITLDTRTTLADRRKEELRITGSELGGTEHFALQAPTRTTQASQPVEPMESFPTELIQIAFTFEKDTPAKDALQCRVFFTRSLPNVFAIILTKDQDPMSLMTQLASLPGMPLQVEWLSAKTLYRLRTTVKKGS
jgi:hypothetical protein